MAAKKEIRSEDTKKATKKVLEAYQQKVAAMSEEELDKFRNDLEPDEMGFCDEEGI